MTNINILFIGDIVGRLGREIVKEILPSLKKELQPDFILINGENAAAGYGITKKVYGELIETGIDVITMGNHMFDKKEMIKELEACPNLLRPANYPKGVPGKDYIILEKKGIKIGVINLIGRVFMQALDCPFKAGEEIIAKIKKEASIIIIDMHAEATSEKYAMGFYLDGKVSAVIGTHTHVQTSDERILPSGTAYISDIGMVGAYNSIIGMDIKSIIERFLTQIPHRFEPVKEGPGLFNAVTFKIDAGTGKAIEIKRIFKVLPAVKKVEKEE